MPQVAASAEDRAVMDAYAQVDLKCMRFSPSPLPDGRSPILVSVVRDELDFLSDFFAHYRTLGVERFAFIDNGSTDGTREFLLRQIDVDLFSAPARFSWPAKQTWINRAMDFYGPDRWFGYVDADERVIFSGYEQRSLADLVAVAERRGISRVRGFLLEMYSDLPVTLSASGDARLSDIYPYYDVTGYTEERLPRLISRIGGVRARVFGRDDQEFKPQLTKYPLFKITEGDFFPNPHHLWPYEANFHSPCLLGILHYKFHGDWVARVHRAVAEKSYWDGSREYRAYAKAIQQDPGLCLHGPVSARLVGSDDLVLNGLIEAVDWGNSTGGGRQKAQVRRIVQGRAHSGRAGLPSFAADPVISAMVK